MALIAAARLLHRQLREPRDVGLREYVVTDPGIVIPRGPDQGIRLLDLLAQGRIRLLGARDFAWPGAGGLVTFWQALAARLQT